MEEKTPLLGIYSLKNKNKTKKNPKNSPNPPPTPVEPFFLKWINRTPVKRTGSQWQ